MAWPNGQSTPPDQWRPLTDGEIEALAAGGNRADDWAGLRVRDGFRAEAVRDCRFAGEVRIGRTNAAVIACDGLSLPVGISGSWIADCEIGDGVAIHNVRYLRRYAVGDGALLHDIGEMTTTENATFGNGDNVADGYHVELINGNGGRDVLAFDGMTAGDAWLWARHRNDAELMGQLDAFTRRAADAVRGKLGVVGAGAVVRSVRMITDARIGPAASVTGATRLADVTINSATDEPTHIGAGVTLVHGIVGRGCEVSGASAAERFVLGDCVALEYGARVIDTVVGDVSTIACCEVRNALLFPAHQQHHNNSFLIAAMLAGQSNVAAGATVGSNHNSRAPDGELHAGRGFWPGLCVSLAHCSRFASFVLLAKGAYPAQLDVPLPFSMVADDPHAGRLLVLPAYWWLYNMYALTRNAGKFHARDSRKRQRQHVEFASLAPDTAEEIFAALSLLELWTGQAVLRDGHDDGNDPAELGRKLLSGPAEHVDRLTVLAPDIEDSSRPVVIAKCHRAYHAYWQMLHYYAVRELLDYMQADGSADLAAMTADLAGPRCRQWVNLGGQIIGTDDFAAMRLDITGGVIDSWPRLHLRCDELWERYARDRQRHALATLTDLLNVPHLSPAVWRDAIDKAVAIQRHICDEVHRTRMKDFDNPFRQRVFGNPDEMLAVLGTAEDAAFVCHVRQRTEQFSQLAEDAKTREA